MTPIERIFAIIGIATLCLAPCHLLAQEKESDSPIEQVTSSLTEGSEVVEVKGITKKGIAAQISALEGNQEIGEELKKNLLDHYKEVMQRLENVRRNEEKEEKLRVAIELC
jgi:hypothetical protein